MFGSSSLQRADASLLRASKSLLAASRFSGVNLENLKSVVGVDGHNTALLNVHYPYSNDALQVSIQKRAVVYCPSLIRH